MIFSETAVTRVDDFDSCGRMLPNAILTLLENTASHHTAAVGADAQNGTVWILTQWRVEICRRPEAGETLRSETWSLSRGGTVSAERGFFLKNSAGEILVRAQADFVLMDLNAGRILRADEELMERYAPEELRPFSDKLPRLRLRAQFERELPLHVRRTDIDFNGHVHNTRYLDYAMEMLPDGLDAVGAVKAFRIVYHSSLRHGDEAYLRAYEDGDELKIGIFVGDKLYTAISLSMK